MDPFATLGLAPAFDVDLGLLEKVHRDLSRALHPDKYVGASATERRTALARAVEVNEAFRIVRDPIRRAEALLALRGVVVGEGQEPKADAEFLMEMLEQREALVEARAARDLVAVRRLSAAIEARARRAEAALAFGFGRGEAATLLQTLGELKFFRRFLDEVSAIEDELAAA
ncbi:MAG: Fe-S protein assembly co-chaperone HscB [Polyangiaceae bacterium]|nr:Fe-S protein assembly co-chaperone HscB [Polyangiaceae bacterium]